MKRTCVAVCILCVLSLVSCDLFGGIDDNTNIDTNDTTGDTSMLAPSLSDPVYSSGSVTLTWTYEDSTVDEFIIGRFDSVWDDDYATVSDGSLRTWSDTENFTPGNEYSYRIKAVKGEMSSELSNTVIITIPYTAIAIAPPLWLRTFWQGTGVTWTITADNVTNSEGLDVKAFNETNKDTPTSCYSTSETDTQFLIGVNGTTYYEFLRDDVDMAVPDSIVVYILSGTNDTLTAPDRADYTSTRIGTLDYVPAGRFQRDAVASNLSVITEPFRISRFEITRTQFSAVMGNDPSNSSYSSGTSDPVQQVNWYHVIAFCNKLSLDDGLTPVYSVSGISDWSTLAYSSIPTDDNSDWNATSVDWDANGYRLPTVAEWTWAAMGAPESGLDGNTDTVGYAESFSGSTGSNLIGEYAVFGYNSGETGATTTQRSNYAGSKLPNELGLYDMSGNVWEWCWDWSGTVPSGTLTDYAGAAAGTTRAVRGGSWWNYAASCLISGETVAEPPTTFFAKGFRVVRR